MFWEWEDAATATWKRFTPKLSRVLSDAFQRGDPFEVRRHSHLSLARPKPALL